MATRRTTTGSVGSVRSAGTAKPAEAEKGAPRRRPSPPAPAAAPEAVTGNTVSEEVRRAMIAQAAYLRAQRRGFAPGGEVEDWMAAEAEVDALLRAGHSGPPQ
jgi:hypothetical protein